MEEARKRAEEEAAARKKAQEEETPGPVDGAGTDAFHVELVCLLALLVADGLYVCEEDNYSQ
jgi:hypothetical protein